MTEDRRSVFLVDHHDIIREGLVSIISREPNLRVCGHASTIREALAAIPSARPDVVVAARDLPDGTVDDLAEGVLRLNARTQIVALVDPPGHGEIRTPGVVRFSKSEDPALLIETLRADGNPFAVARSPGVATLPPHLKRVLVAMSQGKRVREIALDLHLSAHTVKTYMRQLYKALGTTSKAQTLSVAIRQGLIGNQPGDRTWT